MTNTQLKAQIDSQITNETTANAITPTDVGTNLKAVVDYTDQEALLKENVSNKSINVVTDGASDTKYPSVKSVKTYTDGLVVGLLDDRGNYDASVNTFPASGGSGVAGAIMKGDLWYISVSGTLGGNAAAVGASVRALVDSPGQTSANWNILNVGIGYTPENSANKSINITTDAASDVKYPSVKAVKTYVDANAGGGGGVVARGDWQPNTDYAIGDIVRYWQNNSYYFCSVAHNNAFTPEQSGDWLRFGLNKVTTDESFRGKGDYADPLTLSYFKRSSKIYATGTNEPLRYVNFFNGMQLPTGVTESFARVSLGTYELRYTSDISVPDTDLTNTLYYHEVIFSNNPDIRLVSTSNSTVGNVRTLIIRFTNTVSGTLTDGFFNLIYSTTFYKP